MGEGEHPHCVCVCECVSVMGGRHPLCVCVCVCDRRQASSVCVLDSGHPHLSEVLADRQALLQSV